MKRFIEWMPNTAGTDNVESKIDHLYDKAKFAIKIVQMYSKEEWSKLSSIIFGKPVRGNLLGNISTIAPLNSGVYGLYNSGENKKIIGPKAANQIKFKFGNNLIQQNKINKLPNAVVKQHIPDIDENQLVPSDVIHVNVQRIVRELGDSKEAIIEIASTIVHEAVHSIEFQEFGKTGETNTKKAELEFESWAEKNWPRILNSIPQLKSFGQTQGSVNVLQNNIQSVNNSQNIKTKYS